MTTRRADAGHRGVLSPKQGALYDEVLALAAMDGAGTRDVLDGLDAPAIDKAAVAGVLGSRRLPRPERTPMTEPNLYATLAGLHDEHDARRMVEAYTNAGPLTDDQVAGMTAWSGAQRHKHLLSRYAGEDAFIAACTDFAIRRQHAAQT